MLQRPHKHFCCNIFIEIAFFFNEQSNVSDKGYVQMYRMSKQHMVLNYLDFIEQFSSGSKTENSCVKKVPIKSNSIRAAKITNEFCKSYFEHLLKTEGASSLNTT